MTAENPGGPVRQAVVLAAGQGTRLEPLTNYVPKPLIPFWGKPFIDYILDHLSRVVDEAIVVSGTDSTVAEHVGDSHGALHIRHARQEIPRGTGDALLTVEEMVDGPFIVVLADTLPPVETLRRLAQRPCDAAVCVVEVDDPDNHLGLTLGDDERIREVWSDAPTVDGGIFKLGPGAFEILKGLPPRGKELRISQAIDHYARADADVVGVPMPQPWLQFGDHEELSGMLRVMRELAPCDSDSSVDVPTTNCTISNSMVFGPGELIDCEVTDSAIYCEGRIVGRTARGTMDVWTEED